MVELPRQDFEDAVADALDSIPAELTRQLRNVVVLVEDEPADGSGVLGLYEGTPLTERGEGWGWAMPDRITIFQRPLQDFCRTREELVEQIRITVVHEVAHHFGIDDDRLHELGWG